MTPGFTSKVISWRRFRPYCVGALPLQHLPPSRRNLLTGLAAFSALGAGTYAEAKNTAGMGHVILLGDSVFDNAAYVGGAPDVIAQLSLLFKLRNVIE
jgi:hypothetical protein